MVGYPTRESLNLQYSKGSLCRTSNKTEEPLLQAHIGYSKFDILVSRQHSTSRVLLASVWYTLVVTHSSHQWQSSVALNCEWCCSYGVVVPLEVALLILGSVVANTSGHSVKPHTGRGK